MYSASKAQERGKSHGCGLAAGHIWPYSFQKQSRRGVAGPSCETVALRKLLCRPKQLYRRLTQKFLLTRRAGKSTRRARKRTIRKQVRSSNAKRKANAMAAAWREHPFVHGHHARATLGPASASHSNREWSTKPHSFDSSYQAGKVNFTPSNWANESTILTMFMTWKYGAARDSMAKVASNDCIFETPLSHLHLHSWRLRLNQAGGQGSALGPIPRWDQDIAPDQCECKQSGRWMHLYVNGLNFRDQLKYYFYPGLLFSKSSLLLTTIPWLSHDRCSYPPTEV